MVTVTPVNRSLLTALPLVCWAAGCGDFIEYDAAPPEDGLSAVASDGGAGPGPTSMTDAVDHALFDNLLGAHVMPNADGTNRVDYDAMAADIDVTNDLADYLALLATSDARTLQGRPQRLAFWINAYNASVIVAVLEDYEGDPAFSTEGADRLFAFFKQARHRVSGEMLSLDEIEHAVIRGQPERAGVDPRSDRATALAAFHEGLWSNGDVDARIHAALNCAALSCPNLRSGAYAGDEIDDQLEEGVRVFLADSSKGAGSEGISSLFDWFASDFENDAGSVEAFIETHRPDKLSGVDLEQFLTYDWSLNIAP